MAVRVRYFLINLVTNPSSLLDSPTDEDGTITDPHDCGVSIPRITVEGKIYREVLCIIPNRHTRQPSIFNSRSAYGW